MSCGTQLWNWTLWAQSPPIWQIAADLAKEGRELIHRLESGRVEPATLGEPLRAWLKRIRQLLESPPEGKRRWFWWR